MNGTTILIISVAVLICAYLLCKKSCPIVPLCPLTLINKACPIGNNAMLTVCNTAFLNYFAQLEFLFETVYLAFEKAMINISNHVLNTDPMYIALGNIFYASSNITSPEPNPQKVNTNIRALLVLLETFGNISPSAPVASVLQKNQMLVSLIQRTIQADPYSSQIQKENVLQSKTFSICGICSKSKNSRTGRELLIIFGI